MPGMAIEVKSSSDILDSMVRVLHINSNENMALVIPILPKSSGKRLYFVGPKAVSLDQLNQEVNEHKLRILQRGVTPRTDVLATDDELDKKYLRSGQKMSIPREKRAQRYALIKPLVESHENRVLLFDPQVRHKKIVKRANEIHDNSCSKERTVKKLEEILNQYFAEGSTPNALTPLSATQGGRGKEKKQKSKLGAKNTPTQNGEENKSGFIMSDQDKDNCGFGWRNYYIRGTSVAKALRKMWREFYSEISVTDNGKATYKLNGLNDRPSRTQFETWGKKRSPGHESWKKQLSKFNLNRLGRVLFGTSVSDVIGVGQRGAVDSTSIDIELVSVANRLERIGSAHRILIVDSLYGYISGFYLGLEAPSASTVGLAFLHSLTDKTEWLKWLGLDDQSVDDWIPIRYGTVLADNTDLRCQDVVDKLASIDTGIKYVGVARSDLNAPAEISHHILHRMVDHNMKGTTYGQRHERGEEHASILARNTVIESIRESARAIHLHNTIELDIHPTLEMRRDLLDKGIKLTRANLIRWKINQGKCFTSLISEDEARIKLLIPINGTFTQHGVKLLRPDTGKKREFIEPIRYVSNHSLIVERVIKAKMGRAKVHAESHDDTFLHNPYQPTEIYYKHLHTGELIRLDLATKDTDLPYECSLPDVVDLMKRDSLYSFEVKNSRDFELSELEHRQEQTNLEAESAYYEVISQLEKPPSKASLKRNKKENRQHEKEQYMYGMPTPFSEFEAISNPPSYGISVPVKDAPQNPSDSQRDEIKESTNDSKHITEDSNNILLNALRMRRERRNANV